MNFIKMSYLAIRRTLILTDLKIVDKNKFLNEGILQVLLMRFWTEKPNLEAK